MAFDPFSHVSPKDGTLVSPHEGIPVDLAATNKQALPDEERVKTLLTEVGAIEPPVGNPAALTNFWLSSAVLRTNARPIIACVGSGGSLPQADIDLEDQERTDELRLAIEVAHTSGDKRHLQKAIAEEVERLGRAMTSAEIKELADTFTISDTDFKAFLNQLRRRQATDTHSLVSFLTHPGAAHSFTTVKERMTQEFVLRGYAFAEVILDPRTGVPKWCEHIPAPSVWVLPRDTVATTISISQRVSPAVTKRTKVSRFFRRFVQFDFSRSILIYFKEVGDPRTLSSMSGKYYDSPKALQAAEAGIRAGNAMVFWTGYNPDSPYGTPPWLAAIDNVEGAMTAEGAARRFFNRPPGIIAFMNTTADDTEVKNVEDAWNNDRRSRKNFQQITTLKVDTLPAMGGTAHGAKIEFIPIAYQSEADPHHEAYTTRATEVTGQTMGISGILRGNLLNINRATARVAVQMAEKLVFSPMRKDLDESFRGVWQLMGLQHVSLLSTPPQMTDAEEILKLLETSHKGTFMDGNEQRELVTLMLGRKLKRVDAEWGTTPGRLLLSGTHIDEDGIAAPIQDESGEESSVADGNDGENGL